MTHPSRVTLAFATLFFLSACGDGEDKELDEHSGSPTGGRESGGAQASGGTGGGASEPSGGDTSDAGAGGGPLEPAPECDFSKSDSGPFFDLAFSDSRFVRAWWRRDNAPECTVVSSEGGPIARIELACTTDGAEFEETEPVNFELSIDIDSNKLPGFSPIALEPGSLVQLLYGYDANINQPSEEFVLLATEETPGFEAGSVVVAGIYSFDFRGFDLGPLSVSLGPALCSRPDECFDVQLHNLMVTTSQSAVTAPLGEPIELDTTPPLAFHATAGVTTNFTDAPCCADCADHSVSFAVWAR